MKPKDITNDPERCIIAKDLKIFIARRQFGGAAKEIEEVVIPNLKKKGENDLILPFKKQAAFFYSEIGWFEKAYHVYCEGRDPKKARAAIYQRDNLQEEFKKIVDKKFHTGQIEKNYGDNYLLELKKERETAELWEKEGYRGRAAMLQYKLGKKNQLSNTNKAKELIEKEGLTISDLEKFIKECKNSNIVISKTF